jgi:hypothetical protein
MSDALQELLDLIKANDGINDKARLARIVASAFHLTMDRSVYYCAHFAICFSSSASRNFGNTVLSLSNLRKYEDVSQVLMCYSLQMSLKPSTPNVIEWPHDSPGRDCLKTDPEA